MSNRECLLYAALVGYVVENGEVRHPRSTRPVKLLYSANRPYPLFRVDNKTLGVKGPVHVHRLVAYYKFGESMFLPGIQVRHLDSNTFNFSYENISIGTASENMLDKPTEVRARTAAYARSFRLNGMGNKFTDSQIMEMRRLRADGWSLPRLAALFDTGKSYVSMLVRGLVRPEAGGPFSAKCGKEPPVR